MLTLQAAALRSYLQIALVGVAQENTRYAINGVLLENQKSVLSVAADAGPSLWITAPSRPLSRTAPSVPDWQAKLWRLSLDGRMQARISASCPGPRRRKRLRRF